MISMIRILRKAYVTYVKRKVAVAQFATATFFMVETAELESATPCMSSKYSNQLSYASVTIVLYHTFCHFAIPFLKLIKNF